MAKIKIELPSLLSYERSFYPTDALFSSVDAQGVSRPLEITSKTVLGSTSEMQANPEALKADANIQRVEVAMLPQNASLLRVNWNLTVTGSALKPHSCNLPAYRSALQRFAKAYAERTQFAEIARRYAINIANARWAWKNRAFATTAEVTVTPMLPAGAPIVFDAMDYPLDTFENVGDDKIDALAALIAAALAGRGQLRLAVSGVFDVGAQAAVYPSQEFVDRSNDDKDGAVGKVLYSISIPNAARCAALHEQKVGAALRTIDTWHEGASQGDDMTVMAGQPIVINPYGQDRQAYEVVRRGGDSAKGGGNHNLYDLLKSEIPDLTERLSNGDVADHAHFLMGCLIRGGVYSLTKKNKGANGDANGAEADA